jgi:type I restriction enzyme M protein
VMNNDGSGSLFQGNSLERPMRWHDGLRSRELLGKVDVLFTNPPFGTRIPIEDPHILQQYDLAHVWDYDSSTDRYRMRDPRALQRSQPPEVLFIERCLQFLKPGTGLMAIVLPDAILGAPGLGYVRDWILGHAQILASIDLHPDTFQPHNSTQTSILVLRRKSESEIALERAAGAVSASQVFMAVVNHVGHDKRGNPLYVRDLEGNEIVETRVERRRETRDGVVVSREIEMRTKVRDDETALVAQRFRAWLATQA